MIQPIVPGEIIVNIETTDVEPFNGKIFSIAWLDLSQPGAQIQVIVDEDEEGMLRAFMQEFQRIAPREIVGYNLKFDYQWIFNKLMLYRISGKELFGVGLKDVFQLMSQVKEEFVYNARAFGTLDDYAKELLGRAKLGDQETLLRMFTQKNFPYVEAFQVNQIELTRDLYQLYRFVSSTGFLASIPPLSLPAPEETSSSHMETGESMPEKQCLNCLASNPGNASSCKICGGTRFGSL